jgi:subtilisin-like proprotein convertase family protein/V8-like Glu-specific endopeptidase
VGPDIRPAQAGEWQSTVAIRHLGGEHCTGTLVAPKLVITASHCVSDTNPTTYKVHFGNGDESDFDSRAVRVTKVNASPHYRNDVGGNADVAYMVLERPVTDQQIVPVATDPEELRQLFKPGNTGTLVGFGIHDNDTGASGRKYVGPATIRWHTGNEIWMGGTAGDGCNGDSGGPVYGQLPSGEWRVYGVTSRGPSPCGNDAWPGIWGLMHWHLCWIQKDSGETIPSSTLDCSEPAEVSEAAPQSLVDLCRDPDLPAATKRTLHALKVVFAEESSSLQDSATSVSCEELAQWAASTRKLDLSRALLSDLSPLAHFPQLENLAIEDNTVARLDPIAHLDSLKVLRMGWNDVSDFSVLDGRMRAGLRVRGRGLQRPSVDFQSQAFERICIEAQRGNGSADLRASVNAIKAYVAYGRDRGCSVAANLLKGMRYMDLTSRDVRTLEPLRGASGVQYLRLRGLTIQDLSPLADMESLRVLDIEGAVLGDRAPLAQLVEDNGLQIIGNAAEQEASELVSAESGAVDVAIPDNTAAGVTARLTLDHPGRVSRLGVRLRVAHPYPGDLKVELVHPDGTRIVLAERLTGIVTNGESEVALGEGGIDVAALDRMRGKAAAGVWGIVVSDVSVYESGTLKSAALSVQTVGH